MSEERIPILLDTDIGSDIDDAVCLAYLLRQPRCELVGITTVTGEPIQRAMLADAVCRAAGRSDIPIHSGAAEPFFGTQQQPHVPQAEALARLDHRTDFAPNTAVEFMRETIHSRPGEITLLAIGPLTNLGLLFTADPEIPRLLKGLVLMCGQFFPSTSSYTYNEWNAYVDAYATAMVYNAAVTPHLSIGLDVTLRCQMPAEECRRRMQGGPLDAAIAMAEVWFRQAETITFHDPLAAAVIFEPEICQYQDGKVEVELLSRRVLGMTHFEPNADEKPHRVARDVDANRFFDHYFSVAG